jgi:hypothetical protein
LATAAVVVAAYCAILAWQVPIDGIWGGDQGAKIVVVQSLLRSQFRDPALPHAATEVDPSGAMSPLPALFTTTVDGRALSVFSYPYAGLTAIAVFAFGWFGALLVPIAATAVTLLLAATLARRLGVAGAPVPLLIGLATPVLFYALVVWETALAVALLTGAFLLMTRRSPRAAIGAGLFCGLAFWFRDESLLYAFALGAVSWLAGGGVASRGSLAWRYAAGLMAGVAPVLFLHRELFASWSPHYAAAAAKVADLQGSERVAHQLTTIRALLVGDSPAATAWWCGAAAAGALAAVLRRRGRGDLLLALATVLAVVGQLVPTPFAAKTGLLSSSAWLLAAAVVRPRQTADPATARLCLGTAALFIALAAAFAPSDGELQWGPRYLMPAVPLLGVVAWTAIAEAGALRLVSVAALLVLSLHSQRLAVWVLSDATRQSSTLNQIVRAQPARFVASDHRRAIRLLGPSYFSRPPLLVGPEDLPALAEVVRSAGGITWISAAGNDASLAELGRAGIDCASVSGERWLGLRVFACRSSR